MSSQHHVHGMDALDDDDHTTKVNASGWSRSRAWIAVLALFVLASCERTPSKSDYVSARVTEMCKGQTSDELQACRLAVIGQFTKVSLEEMQLRYPAPEPRMRPSCGV